MNKIIGQTRLLAELSKQIKENTLPRFIILVGTRGSGKSIVASEISKKLDANQVICNTSVDSIREIIKLSYKAKTSTIYTILNADNMSLQAKNSLLKVTEEPPNNAYYILTLEDENNTLETIKSRGTVFYMDKYTPSDIGAYSIDKYNSAVDGTLPLYKDLCDTPGEVDLLYSLNPYEFYEYVKKVVEHIATTSGANAFKIADKISMKDGDDKYDLKMFWKTFSKVLFDTRTNMSGIRITDKYLGYLNIRGINKQMLFDEWLLEIRADWRMRYEV